jgi:hypothetical protein
MQPYGEVLGVPYDFRRPTWSRVKERMWNPDDERLITPRDFGIGWSVNFYQLHRQYPALFWLLTVFAAVRIIQRTVRFFNKEKSD